MEREFLAPKKKGKGEEMKKECVVIKCEGCGRSKTVSIEDMLKFPPNWFLELPQIYCPQCKLFLTIDIKEVDFDDTPS